MSTEIPVNEPKNSNFASRIYLEKTVRMEGRNMSLSIYERN